MKDGSVPILIGAFVMLIIGISLIGIVATTGNAVTELTKATDESFSLATSGIRATNGSINGTTFPGGPVVRDLTNTNTGWKTSDSDCEIATPSHVGNTTAATASAYNTLTVTTDYTLSVDGALSLVYTTKTASVGSFWNTTYLSYEYCADDYLSESWFRTIIDLVPGFFAIALLLISIGLFYQVAKNEGLFSL